MKYYTTLAESADNITFRTICYWLQLFLEEVGTGGGAFRRLYSKFLKKAAEILDSHQLEKMSFLYNELATKWKNFAKELDSLSKGEIRDISFSLGLLEEIVALEEENAKKLYEVSLILWEKEAKK